MHADVRMAIRLDAIADFEEQLLLELYIEGPPKGPSSSHRSYERDCYSAATALNSSFLPVEAETFAYRRVDPCCVTCLCSKVCRGFEN